ncbi:NmrA/HSCARG family protein [Hassallia byssoidea VB512170]|uniref:NmrA/HSCARG family protein n=1 Tax=Hassallia byssoidea VB512170 TaxID=1304833 RepID=A0A846HLS7_9CYAN|nr:NmrA/HSCARG family protein [Hassalia byssoidea]NEU76921.1 NmrA/HSCARG family protein [Hassalia byssoidea VB512170]
MAEQTARTILVIGATGAMGRPIVRRLLTDENNWRIRALTRNPESSHAQELLEMGANGNRVELVKGDTNDRASVATAMSGIYGVFCNTNFWQDCMVTTEREQGLQMLEAARQAGVQHFVYSSLDSCVTLSHGRIPVPHFDAKAAVEHEINWRRSDEFMRQEADGWYSRHVTVLVTLPYIENVKQFAVPERGTLSDGREGVIFRLPLADAQWSMVALDDIAFFTAYVFAHPDEWGGRTLPIGSDSLTFQEIAATLERVSGVPAEYRPMTLEEYAALGLTNVHDVINMLRFCIEYGMPRDRESLRKIHPDLMTFEQWVKKTGWRGEPGEVQKDAMTGSK